MRSCMSERGATWSHVGGCREAFSRDRGAKTIREGVCQARASRLKTWLTRRRSLPPSSHALLHPSCPAPPLSGLSCVLVGGPPCKRTRQSCSWVGDAYMQALGELSRHCCVPESCLAEVFWYRVFWCRVSWNPANLLDSKAKCCKFALNGWDLAF